MGSGHTWGDARVGVCRRHERGLHPTPSRLAHRQPFTLGIDMTTIASTDYIRDLELTVDDAATWLMTLPEPTVTWRPSPTKWSAKELIGHLIDSAANNHQ